MVRLSSIRASFPVSSSTPMTVRGADRGDYAPSAGAAPNGAGARGGQLLTPKASAAASTIPPTSLNKGTSPPRTKSVPCVENTTYVGFANLPNQVFRRAMKRGFEFTLMVVGQSGLGKSTFINTLFLAEINEAGSERRTPPSTLHIDVRTMRLVESGVKLTLTLVDTPGFGDLVDNSKCWEPIIDFIDRKYLDYFTEETKIERAEHIPDHRVHLCLYFIAPSGHGLKQLDIEFLKRLDEHVNVIPVIAKADTLTAEELSRFKKQIMADLRTHQIKEYNFPDILDGDERHLQQSLRDRVPFAIVGSNTMRADSAGRRTRYREYAWGTVEVENMAHNDFIALRDMIIGRNLIDLIDVTRGVHYENFRCRQLSKITKGAVSTTDRDPLTQLEQERSAKFRDLKERTTKMNAVFDEKVAIREAKLDELRTKVENAARENHAAIEERRAQLEALQSEVQEMRQRAGFGTHDSRTSVNSDQSPPEKNKKKGAMSIFGRSKTDE